MTESSDKTVANADDVHPAILGDSGLFPRGQMLGGKYEVISLLGKGGMGTVYRVQQVFLNEELALKVLDNRRESDGVHMRRFQQEAKAAYSLSHPNLVKVHDFGLLDNGQPYLVMDLIEGVTLARYIKEHGPLVLDEVGPLFAQACFGLSHAHNQSVIHRDIKPTNIMLVTGLPLGTEGSVKIVDFGIAKLASDHGGEIQTLTRTGEIIGSPLYMSPEQCSGAPVDHRTDIYSLGCVLFEALTGTPPFLGDNVLRTMMMHQTEPAPLLKEASLGKEFPEGLKQIVDKMLRKSPSERYQNLGLVAHDLARACKDGGLITGPRSATKAQPKGSKAFSITARQYYASMAMIVLITAIVTELVSHVLQRTPAELTFSPSPSVGRSIAQHDTKDIQPSPESDTSLADSNKLVLFNDNETAEI